MPCSARSGSRQATVPEPVHDIETVAVRDSHPLGKGVLHGALSQRCRQRGVGSGGSRVSRRSKRAARGNRVRSNVDLPVLRGPHRKADRPCGRSMRRVRRYMTKSEQAPNESDRFGVYSDPVALEMLMCPPRRIVLCRPEPIEPNEPGCVPGGGRRPGGTARRRGVGVRREWQGRQGRSGGGRGGPAVARGAGAAGSGGTGVESRREHQDKSITTATLSPPERPGARI